MTSNIAISACGSHQSLMRMPEFWRAVEIARECAECYVEEATG